MARASTPTKLPLDTWAELIGFHPFHFNGLNSNTYLTNLQCGGTWLQHAYQNAGRLGREDIALAIKEAEDMIEDHLGYHLLPDWIESERDNFTRPALRDLYNANGRNVRGQRVSLTAHRGWILSGGVRVKDGIETAAVARSDADGDLYDELVTVSVGTSVTDPDEIKVYYPGEEFADEWEIRPINVSIAANVATITFKSWQIVKPELQERLDGVGTDGIDAENDANYLTTVDVVRVYNDPQTQVTFIWELDKPWLPCGCGSATCITCQLGTQTGCFHLREERIGILVPAPGTWSVANQGFTPVLFSEWGAPDQALLHYYSGFQDRRLSRSKSVMAKFWQQAVAYYASSLLTKAGCGCEQATQYIEHWRSDRSFSSRTTGTSFQTQSQLTNPLGSTEGAKYAWERITAPGRKIER